jgi:hypothetical protein
LAKLKLLKKKKTALGCWHSKQAANMLFCTVGAHKLLLQAKRLAEGPARRETAEPATPPDSANYISRARQFCQ